jgi:phage tail sheath protein FI
MAFQVSPGVNVSEVDLTTTVPGVSSTVGALAGVFRWGPVGEKVLIDSEDKLVTAFGRPTSYNPETFFTAANFLGYGDSLFVVRAANTADEGANAALNSVANTGTLNVASVAVKNRDDYDSKVLFDANSAYVAKYPGAIGDSLRISVCDSAAAYESNIDLIGVQNSNDIFGSFSISVGSNTGVLSFVTPSPTAGVEANAYANGVITQLSIGDLIKLGNSSIGTQYIKITALGTTSTTSNATASIATVNVSFSDSNKLFTDYVISNTVNGNTTVANLTRNWEYFNLVDLAPGTSDWVATYGNTAAVDQVHVVVADHNGEFTGVAGGILEVFPAISRATDAKSAEGASIYYKTVINDSSRYIWWTNDRAGALSNTAQNIANSGNLKPLTLDFTGGQDGAGEANISIATLASAYDLFRNKESVDISLVMAGKPRGGASNTQLGNYLIDNIAETRKDCVVFITPDDGIATSNPGNEASALVTWRSSVRDSSYGFLDSGYKYMYDRYNDVYRYVPLNGDIAGLAARSDAATDPWYSPAGFNRGQIRNIVKLRFNPTQADRDLLYKNSINPVISFPGQGTVLYGDKTATSKPSAFDRLNVRRLFTTLEKSISEAAKFSLFEFNDEFTRAQFRNLVTPFLRDVQARRGIVDFLVVCDSTNNTPERVDRNEFWGDIYIKPNRSINFIQLNFVAVRTGVEFSTITGRF